MNELKAFLLENSVRFYENEPMKNRTSFRIGGDAKLFIEPENEQELSLVLEKCRSCSLEPFIIGNGSNLLVSDSGIERPVIKLCGEFEKITLVDETTVRAGAGAMLVSLCRFALLNSLSGLEFAYGIPGSVGGAVFMNAGAYGGEMKNVVEFCEHVDRRGNKGKLSKDELSFSYRKSAYGENGFVVTFATFKLQKGEKGEVEEKMNELLNRRKDKQPLSFPSAGSVFKRPEGYFAGALIEQSGLKGKRIGGAMVSEKHAGFIVNAGAATCRDVKSLVEFCQKTVFEKFGVNLETEIKMI